MKGGVILFRGSGAAALRNLESDLSRADDYYLEGGTAIAEFAAVHGVSTNAGRQLIGDAVALHDRLPRCWQRMRAWLVNGFMVGSE